MQLKESYDRRHVIDSEQPWEAFWSQTAGAGVDGELDAARASRSQAEAIRQDAANEILATTKEMCQRLMADAERAVERAKYLESEAEVKSEQAERQNSDADTVRNEAEAYRQKAIAETDARCREKIAEAEARCEEMLAKARAQAETVQDSAKSDAERESEGLRQAASAKAQSIVAQAETIRAAAREELEAQRIYSETARLKADSFEVLSQMRDKIDEMMASPKAAINGHAPAANGSSESPASVEAVASEEVQASQNGSVSKPKRARSRKPSSANGKR